MLDGVVVAIASYMGNCLSAAAEEEVRAAEKHDAASAHKYKVRGEHLPHYMHEDLYELLVCMALGRGMTLRSFSYSSSDLLSTANHPYRCSWVWLIIACQLYAHF